MKTFLLARFIIADLCVPVDRVEAETKALAIEHFAVKYIELKLDSDGRGEFQGHRFIVEEFRPDLAVDETTSCVPAEPCCPTAAPNYTELEQSYCTLCASVATLPHAHTFLVGNLNLPVDIQPAS